MSTATILLALTSVALGEVIPNKDVEKLNSTYQQLWETDFVWKFDDLPLEGGVRSEQVPYSGYIYPDKQGGTTLSLRKYDRAFNGGRMKASDRERWDTTAFKEPVNGFFGAVLNIKETPRWYGHCNGWASAAIRHAEPVHSVTKNGVTFSPSDIKALLAELYVYNEHIVLAGENGAPVGAAAFHAIIANWIGRGEHALGIEAEPGEEKWNYPAYAFSASAAKHSPRSVEVTMNLAYAMDSRAEWDESPRFEEVKFFHYALDLDADGKIVGGRFFRDSSSIDMLWVPLRPKAPGETGNENGNPYIDVETILSLWRDSAPSENRAAWFTVDSTEIIDRDRLRSPVAAVVVDDVSDTEPADVEVPSRIVPRSFALTGSAVSRAGRCYRRLDPNRAADRFDELLGGGRTDTAALPLADSPVR